MPMVSRFLDWRRALLAVGSSIIFLEELDFALITVNLKTITFYYHTEYFTAVGLESHLRKIIEGRKVPLSPVSLPVLERMRDWIEDCTEESEHARSRPNWTPSRLLRITDLGRKVCLHTPDKADIRYTTLSHCWGTVPPTALTSQTLQRFETGIKTNELPQTFQDAIWLTYQLHISFIWIDSLCIFQDDPDDWSKESSSMHYVYENSSVTIAATRATNSTEGFLGNRIERSYLPVPFKYQGIAGEVLAFDLALNCVGDPKRTVWMEQEPLTARGWALQERYLSRRTLHFTKHQILFESQLHCLAESYASSHKLPSMTKIMSRDYFNEVDRKGCLQDWYRLVQMYSMRKLTISDDKLPALSGLAANFSSHICLKIDTTVPSSQYLAGLWSHDIIRGLCWQSSDALRSPNYRAPTWSWASLDGRIEYRIPWLDSINELACVESINVDLESPERIFGKVLGGCISLRAIKLRPYTIAEPINRNLWFSEDGASFRLGFSWDLESYRSRERESSLASIINETCLIVVPLGWIAKQLEIPDDPDRLLGPFCLILEAVRSPSHSHTAIPIFQRVGSGMIMHGPDGKGISKDGLKRLIIDKWAIRKEQGKLEEILII